MSTVKKTCIRKLLYGLGAVLLLCFIGWLLLPKPDLWGGLDFSRHIYDRNGELLRLDLSSDEKYRIWLSLDEMPPDLLEATLLYEDRYFRWHPGVNPLALARAAAGSYLGGGRRMGASTITMQLARLRFNLDTRDIPGKLRQIFWALALERHYSKDEILEAYFNVAPYGGNIEGVGAAAAIYFNKRAALLSLAECLSLATVPQNPSSRNPLAAAGRAWDEARVRLNALWVEQHPEDADNAYFSGLPLAVRGPGALPFIAPHLSTELLAAMPRPPAGENAAVQTTLDSTQQELLERIVTNYVAQRRAEGIHNASLVLVHWPRMEVRALLGSADFFNAGIQGQVDGTRGLRSPGSTLKPFIYALGLEQGHIHPMSLMIDAPQSFGGYDPENADQAFRGPLSARDALFLSRNIPAIQLASRLSGPDLYDFLQSAHLNLPKDREHYGLSLVLGGAELTGRRLAELYCMLANHGLWQPLKYVRAGEGGEGQGSDENAELLPERLLSPEASVLALSMIQDNPAQRQLRFVGRNLDKLPRYWKTGTSNGFRDAWAAGIFGPYALVVWIGNFDNTPNPKFLGAEAAGPLFHEIADALASRERVQDTALRNLAELNVVEIPVCAATGDVDTSLCPETVNTLFIPGVSPIRSTNVFRSILIDVESGLRACVEDPPRTKRVVWEFWPTDLQRIFTRAGISKAPPPRYMPGCEGQANLGEGGMPPQIIAPKYGVVYHASMGRPESSVIPLTASADADVERLFWFEGSRLIGSVAPSEPLLWQAVPGSVSLTVTDNFGRSATRVVRVESIP